MAEITPIPERVREFLRQYEALIERGLERCQEERRALMDAYFPDADIRDRTGGFVGDYGKRKRGRPRKEEMVIYEKPTEY